MFSIFSIFQLLSSNIVTNGNGDEGLNGFMVADVKKEVRRAAKLVCLKNLTQTITGLNSNILFYFFRPVYFVVKVVPASVAVIRDAKGRSTYHAQ